MIKFKQLVSKKDKREISFALTEYPDYYRDFYITKNYQRLFLQDNPEWIYKCLKAGDKIAFGEEEGICLIYGFSDNANRKYAKVLYSNNYNAYKLLQVAKWNIDYPLFVKVKKTNPILEVLTDVEEIKCNKCNNKFTIYGSKNKINCPKCNNFISSKTKNNGSLNFKVIGDRGKEILLKG